MTKLIDQYKVDRTVWRAVTFEEGERQDREYWSNAPVEEHWNVAELLRQTAYGYDPSTARLPRPIDVLERRAR